MQWECEEAKYEFVAVQRKGIALLQLYYSGT